MAPTFASAAASGGNSNSSRADGASEWSRRANGATQTFRRSSQATTTSSSTTASREAPPASSSTQQPRNSSESSGVYVPPHVNASRNGAAPNNETLRYSKDRVLDIFRAEQAAGNLIEGLASLYVGNFQPSASNGVSSASPWGRRDEHKDNSHSVELCWDRNAHMFPMGLQEWTDEERELFNGSVNSPIKPPAMNNKEGGASKDGANNRKTSISQNLNSPGAFGLSSPTQSRPGNRRRETGDAYPFPNTSLASPSNSRFSKEETSSATPPAALLRRRTEQQKDASSGSGEERDRDKSESLSGGGLKRSGTGGLGASGTSTWGTSGTSAFSPMGSFGNFALGGSTPQPVTEKRPGYGSMRGQSRFAGLMKDSSGDLKEKSSSGDLGQQGNTEQERQWTEQRQNKPVGEETDLYADDEGVPSGSAALGGGLDESPPKQQRGFSGFGVSTSRVPDDGGLASLGMTADTVSYHDFGHQTPQQQRQHGGEGVHEPMSPTNTNPYQSPENERTDLDELHDGHEMSHGGPLPGLGGFRGANQGQGGLPGLGSNFPALGTRVPASYEAAASDRSQTSSTGPSRGFSSLSGLGGLPGLGGSASPWSAGPQGLGTPTRDRSGLTGAFGEGLMTSTADMHSPILAGLGSGNVFAGPGGFGSVRSKMGSLFPSAMQEQMRMGEGGIHGQEEQGFDTFARQHSGLGPLARGPLNPTVMGSAGPARDTGSPFRNNRGMFDDLMDHTPRNEMPSAIGEPSGMFGSMQSSQTPLSSVPHQDPHGLSRKSQSNLQRPSSNLTSPSSSQPPLQQMRTMVMPDRMRWIYKDPQGATQGPWSGLEMHDWYRAGFFTPELLIKRVEDPEFEPLAQLIRRIGNSREPFLVPQIGVPHESASASGKTPGVGGGVQPPFPNSFPSFGTTLTAEQQNALERRKQEEQFLMARQKEHLAQQQLYMKQQLGMQAAGGPQVGAHGLIHHSSAHSLHSQPSFGSVTSPAAYQPSPSQGPMVGGPAVPGFFDGAFRVQQQGQALAVPDVLGSIRESEVPGLMERMNLNNNNNRGASTQQSAGQQLPLGQGLPDEIQSSQIATMLQDRARLQREQAEHDRKQSGPKEEEREALAAQERFQQFKDLRAQEGAAEDQELRQITTEPDSQVHEIARDEMTKVDEKPEETLTQQVQAASAAKQASAQQSPWGKADASQNANHADRPPQSSSPMPAPVAQRKHNVADNLVAETRSRTQSPAVETPTTSVAPWANQAVEIPKTQSLKEIQEAEAKRAAKQEALAAAERRAAYERELAAAQAAASMAPAPGLPTGATWATQSPTTSTGSAQSVWGAKTATKPNAGKTLQQIQKEEEAKKQRAALAAAASAASITGPAPSSAGGKRYADLAGKSASPASPIQAAGWSTVGAGGKIKASTTPASAVSGTMAGRSVSGNTTSATSMKSSPVSRSSTMGAAQLGKLNKVDAMGEFKKWAIGELQRGGLHNGINASDFMETLLVLPSEIDIITEAVHSSAQTIDSRHFAEEFVRRKKQADKGVIEPSTTASPSTAKANDNAWSAVAKKGQTTAASSTPVPAASGEFKVAKAKGRRK
ncbi:uncharacterized protein PV09_00602 [Verruconis gallopava]|uniref:GYF domain-containing protein n=1 Tax=Verruconis gallopava TaxID=253628 RepID=A0A0D1Z6Q7_9PEZI|nr:uncharacterized protein PV09_00602 [Verruconis gallopava]KIW08647.1 hypothetical protein PV09_00602 [Verruconis gallopava]